MASNRGYNLPSPQGENKKEMSIPNKYNVDADGNEIYPTDNNVEVVVEKRYALDKNNIPFYPRDANRNEFINPELGLIERNGEYIYPKTVDGRPNYRDDPSDQGVVKRKVYETINNKTIIGRNWDGDQCYATDKNGDEYYPADNTPAKKANGTIFYARTAANDIIFPINSDGDEYYLTFINPLEPDTNPGRYARQNNNTDEIYPQRLTIDNLLSDYIINNKYAEKNSEKYYPKDGYNNEFYIKPVNNTGGAVPPTDIVLSNYAVTNDGKVILPGIGGKHYIDPNKKPAVADTDILGKLVREGKKISSDYLTKVEVSNKPKVPLKKYKYYDFNTNIFKTIYPAGTGVTSSQITILKIPFYKTWYFWVFVLSIFILKSFAIWWFFFRHSG